MQCNKLSTQQYHVDGSIVWKTEFSVAEMVFGYVNGYHRRFWQGSPDHRGTPEALGRVVTLISNLHMIPLEDCKDACTWGRSYSIPKVDIIQVMAQLDHREKVQKMMI